MKKCHNCNEHSVVPSENHNMQVDLPACHICLEYQYPDIEDGIHSVIYADKNT